MFSKSNTHRGRISAFLVVYLLIRQGVYGFKPSLPSSLTTIPSFSGTLLLPDTARRSKSSSITTKLNELRNVFHPFNHLSSRQFASTSQLGGDAGRQDPPDSTNQKVEIVTSETEKPKNRAMLIWIHLLSAFIGFNYTQTSVWPSFLETIPLRGWSLLHGISAMLFSGAIVTTTILEWTALQISDETKNESSLPLILGWLWQLESLVVLPAVSMSLVSGMAQSFAMYATFRHAPFHVKSALHIMFLFGLWWMFTDYRSQRKLKESFEMASFETRKTSNLVSCGFVLALYAIMILKPAP